eukprot:scaffold20981_cov122-Isochrysis_galbana.AAC.4
MDGPACLSIPSVARPGECAAPRCACVPVHVLCAGVWCAGVLVRVVGVDVTCHTASRETMKS